MRLNHVRVIPGRGCVCGVVGCSVSGLLTRSVRVRVSGSIWDGAPEWVRVLYVKACAGCVSCLPRVAAGSWNLL